MDNQQAQAGPDLIGQVIADRYRLVRKLGEGGMGEVYEAEHIHIEKRVALKLLRAEIMSNQEAVTRFRQEARSASSIGHRNIIQIDDFGTLPDGRVYLTMEFLGGAPLSDLAKQGLPLDQALDILLQTCIGLGAAHAKGIVHRDMKPDNVFVTAGSDGKPIPKILDFGIAKVSGADGAQAHLTRTGTIFGTPYYMAPEQALGQAIDHRADVYALGVIMYEVFAGSVPFKADSFMGILTMHITTPPTPPSQVAAAHGRWLPPELEALILRSMAKNPTDRHQSMNELAEALQTIYRQYVGAGSTQPLAAQPVSQSRFMPVPTGHISAQQFLTPGSGLQPTMAPPGLGGPMVTPPGGLPPNTPMGMPPVGAMTPGSGMGMVARTGTEPVQFHQPRKSGSGVLVTALVVLILAGGGGAAWYFLAGPGAKPAVVVTDNVTPDAAPAVTPPDPLPKSEPDAAVAVKPPDPLPEDKPPEIVQITVTIDSDPRGAKIFEGDEYHGDTPYKVTVEKGKPVQLSIEKPGFETAKVTVDGADTKLTAKLDKAKVSTTKRDRDRDKNRGKGKDVKPGTDQTPANPQTGQNGQNGQPQIPKPPDKPPQPDKPPHNPGEPDDSGELE